jgi:hypothetical protein
MDVTSAQKVTVVPPGGGFENYFRELGELVLASEAGTSGARKSLPETYAFAKLVATYGLIYENPVWLDDVTARFSLNRPAR